MLKQKQSYGIRVRFFKLKDSDQVSRLLTTLSRTPAVEAKTKASTLNAKTWFPKDEQATPKRARI